MRLPRVLSSFTIVALAACGDEGPSAPPNAPPTAVFTIQCARRLCATTNTSTDADGTIEAYAWDFGDQTARVTTPDATHTYATTGQFTVALTVTDDDGETSITEATVDVDDVNRVPTAAFTFECIDLFCSFTDRSSDPDGALASYRWDYGDGSPPVLTRSPEHTYGRPGAYTVRLTVLDSDGASASAEAQANPTHTNILPGVSFSSSCTDLTCDFKESTYDWDGSIAAYLWTFRDGSTSREANPRHTFPSPGAYDVDLTVTDDSGGTRSFTSAVLVPLDFDAACVSTECTFAPKLGAGWHLSWRFGDGMASLETRPTHTYHVTQPTSFTVTLTVYDDFLDEYSNSHEIAVSP